MARGGNGGGPAKGLKKILGNWKDNTLIGTDGVDAIFGRGGNDTLIGGAGADVLDGGDGNDWASYAESPAGVSVDLAAGIGLGGDAEGDMLINIENLEGSAFDDTLSGDDGANALRGDDGGDWLFGAGGNDTLTGGAGNDQYVFDVADPALGDDIITDFQVGFDKISFNAPAFNVLADAVQAGSDVVITYGAGSTITLQNTLLGDLSGADFAFPGQNLIIGTEFGDFLIGTAGSDKVFGLGGDDNIDGDGGDDHLQGDAGDDIILGGAGNDTLLGGAGGDILRGDSGADVIDGGDGIDWALYNTSSAGVSIDLAAGTASGGDADGDVLMSVEVVLGSGFADTLSGDGGANFLSGGGGDDVIDGRGGDDHLAGDAGTDTLLGGTGDDTLNGGAGADDLQGGTGSDTASYSGSAGVIINLALGTISGGDADGDTFSSIENLEGSQGSDLLTGDAGENVIDGGFGGSDTIFGGGGNDTLSAFFGNNTLDGGTGDDFLSVNGSNFDTMTGGGGGDTFILFGPTPIFNGTIATTTITDFEPGIDKIVFATSFDVLAAAEQQDDDVLIEFTYIPGLSVLLQNTLIASLSADDFMFSIEIAGAGVDDPGFL